MTLKMKTYTPYQNTALLLLRLIVAIIFFHAGIAKWFLWSIGPMEGMPVWLHYMMRFLSIAEPIGAAALVAGFLTRAAAACLAIIMIGSIPVSHFLMSVPFFTAPELPGWDFNLMILGGCLAVAGFGAGRWSVDARTRGQLPGPQSIESHEERAMTSDNRSRATAEIRSLIENWATSVRDLDLDGVVADHADSVLMFDVPPPVQIRGIDGYRQTWPPFFDWLKSGGTFEIDSLEVTAGEDVAYATALLRCGRTEELASDPEPRLRLTVGLRKEAGGWIIAHEHHSFPSDL